MKLGLKLDNAFPKQVQINVIYPTITLTTRKAPNKLNSSNSLEVSYVLPLAK